MRLRNGIPMLCLFVLQLGFSQHARHCLGRQGALSVEATRLPTQPEAAEASPWT